MLGFASNDEYEEGAEVPFRGWSSSLIQPLHPSPWGDRRAAVRCHIAEVETPANMTHSAGFQAPAEVRAGMRQTDGTRAVVEAHGRQSRT